MRHDRDTQPPGSRPQSGVASVAPISRSPRGGMVRVRIAPHLHALVPASETRARHAEPRSIDTREAWIRQARGLAPEQVQPQVEERA